MVMLNNFHLFREFMSQLMQTGFNPEYGFFKTTSQQLLYPNPDAICAQPDYLKHFHFLGRMLGKIIYESMMVELPLADFFLCKLLNRYNSDVDIYHLESLDPELYKYETFDIFIRFITFLRFCYLHYIVWKKSYASFSVSGRLPLVILNKSIKV